MYKRILFAATAMFDSLYCMENTADMSRHISCGSDMSEDYPMGHVLTARSSRESSPRPAIDDLWLSGDSQRVKRPSVGGKGMKDDNPSPQHRQKSDPFEGRRSGSVSATASGSSSGRPPSVVPKLRKPPELEDVSVKLEDMSTSMESGPSQLDNKPGEASESPRKCWLSGLAKCLTPRSSNRSSPSRRSQDQDQAVEKVAGMFAEKLAEEIAKKVVQS